MEKVKLPLLNDEGYYEIRIESIGGLGANLCGKMLGELALKFLGLNSAGFSSDGSEKTGTPVKAYVRYCRKDMEIRLNSPVKRPHMLCIFHEALMQNPEIFNGCSNDTVIVINSDIAPENIINSYLKANEISGARLVCVPALSIAMETKSRINVVMLGAMAKASGFIPMECVNKICSEILWAKYPDVLENNLQGIYRGYNEAIQCNIPNYKITSNSKENGNSKGYENMLTGGVNLSTGSTITNDLSPSRQGYIPVFIKERCINCGMCDVTCPDMVFQFEKGTYKGKEMMVNKGLDYFHCKGCLRCVEICPTQALIKGKEKDYSVKPWFIPNIELKETPDCYEKTGADGYITSEAFLDEKRIEGGEV